MNCLAAKKCLETHWKIESSVINVPRTNIVAERAVKLMEELYCKSNSSIHLNTKFVATNNFNL